MRNIPTTIGWLEGLRTMRGGPSPYWFYLRLPFVYPIVHIFLHGETEQLCADYSLFHHRKEDLEAHICLLSLIIPRVEPRHSSLGTDATVHMLGTDRVVGWCIQGCTGGYIPGWCTTYHGGWVVCAEWCPFLPWWVGSMRRGVYV